MRTVRVIPCLDVDAGRVVKGVRFTDLFDAGDPVELAARYDAQGADELVFLDITASSDHRRTMVEVVSRTAEVVFIPFTVGGGVRSVEDARLLLRAGADKVGVNTAAVDRPELVAELADEFGSQCVVVAVDARRRRPDPERRSGAGLGGVHPRGPHAHRARRPRLGRAVCGHGAGEILLTSMDRDGTRDGFDLELTRLVAGAARSRSSPRAAWAPSTTWSRGPSAGEADAVLAASIFHLGEFTVARPRSTSWRPASRSGRRDVRPPGRSAACRTATGVGRDVRPGPPRLR